MGRTDAATGETQRRPSRPSAALVIASLALAAALAPPAYSALAPKLAKNTVGSPQIKDKSIQATDLDKNVVTTSKIARGEVRRSDLANGSVDFSKIADGTIGRAEIAANSVDGSKIADGSVGQADLTSPTQLRAWTAYPSSEVAVAPAATLDLGSLVVSGGGPLVAQPAGGAAHHRTGLREPHDQPGARRQGPALVHRDRRRQRAGAPDLGPPRAGRRGDRAGVRIRDRAGRQPRRGAVVPEQQHGCRVGERRTGRDQRAGGAPVVVAVVTSGSPRRTGRRRGRAC